MVFLLEIGPLIWGWNANMPLSII